MSDKIWSDGLTGDQISTVERAAKAAWESFVPSTRGTWDSLYPYERDVRLGDTLAALIASGHPDFPPPKVPSRGAVVADKVVNLRMGHLCFMYPDGTGQIMEMRNPDDCLQWTRQAVAAHIDAERAAALDAAVKHITDGCHLTRTDLAKAILALKGAK